MSSAITCGDCLHGELGVDAREGALEFLDDELALLLAQEPGDGLEDAVLVKLGFSERLALHCEVVQGLIKKPSGEAFVNNVIVGQHSCLELSH